MTRTPPPPRFSDLLHLRGNGLERGDPVALPPLVQSTMFHQPGTPEGGPGYGRVSNRPGRRWNMR